MAEGAAGLRAAATRWWLALLAAPFAEDLGGGLPALREALLDAGYAAAHGREGAPTPATEAAGPSPDPRIPSDEAPWPNESLAAASDAAPPPPLVSPGGEVDARWDSSTAKLSRGLNDRERARAPLPIAAARRPPDWPPRPDGHAPFRSARPAS